MSSSRDHAQSTSRGDHSAARVATPVQLLNGKPFRVIIHAPAYMMSRAADIAARQWASGVFEEHEIVGIVSGEHAFTLKRTKTGVSVWHFRTVPGVVADPRAISKARAAYETLPRDPVTGRPVIA